MKINRLITIFFNIISLNTHSLMSKQKNWLKNLDYDYDSADELEILEILENKLNKSLCYDFLKMNIYSLSDEKNYKCMNEKNSLCSLCGGNYKKAYVSYIYFKDKQIKTSSCFLCNTIVNFKNLYIGKCFLVFSNMSQNDINFKILDSFNINGDILTPLQIDSNSKLISLSIYEFINAYILMNELEKDKFNNFKVMFTSNAISSLKDTGFTNYFSTSENTSANSNVKKHDNIYFESISGTYEITPKQKKILNKYINKFKSEQYQAIQLIKQSLDSKRGDVINKNKLMDTFGEFL